MIPGRAPMQAGVVPTREAVSCRPGTAGAGVGPTGRRADGLAPRGLPAPGPHRRPVPATAGSIAETGGASGHRAPVEVPGRGRNRWCSGASPPPSRLHGNGIPSRSPPGSAGRWSALLSEVTTVGSVVTVPVVAAAEAARRARSRTADAHGGSGSGPSATFAQGAARWHRVCGAVVGREPRRVTGTHLVAISATVAVRRSASLRSRWARPRRTGLRRGGTRVVLGSCREVWAATIRVAARHRVEYKLAVPPGALRARRTCAGSRPWRISDLRPPAVVPHRPDRARSDRS